MINIVLHEPEMPANTGNIGRTCVATNTRLHLIEPMGFMINDKMLKRAGLDYWDKLDVTIYDDTSDFFAKNPEAVVYYFSTKARYGYTDVPSPQRVFLMFGRETRGLPEELLQKNPDTTVRIPMLPHLRSLNLSNSVAVAVYEVLRQRNFAGLTAIGEPRTFQWGEHQM